MTPVVPRGVRNNNPGNLIWVETIQWQGQTGHDGRFCTFDSAENGIRALCKQLLVYQDKYALRTIKGIINRWAPPNENDTGAYVRAVSHFMVFAEDDLLELHNDTILSSLATAIITHENGQQPYAEELIRNAARRALGWAFVPDIEPVDLTGNDSHTGTQPAAPIEDHSPQPETLMPVPLVLSAIAAFGPAIVEMIPAIAKLFDKSAETPAKLEAAQTVVKSTNSTNLQEAVEKMTADPVLRKAAEAAVLTAPGVTEYLEIGGGISAAREANLAAQSAPQGFWRNPAFWFVMVAVVPPLYAIVGTLVWRMAAPSEQLVTQVITAILGLASVAGAYYLGSTAGSARKTEIIANKEQ